MRRSLLIPSLSLLVGAAGLQAADLADGKLHINGWVDVVGTLTDTTAKRDTTADMFAAGKLSVGYDVIKDKVKAVVEGRYRDSEDGNDPSKVTVDQAYVEINTCPMSKITAGYFYNWLGIEGVDPVNQNRINHSIVWNNLTGITVSGVKFDFNFIQSEKSTLGISAALVDEVVTVNGHSHKDANDLAGALIIYGKRANLGEFQISVTDDTDSKIKANGEKSDVITVDAFAKLTMCDKWNAGLEGIYQYLDNKEAQLGVVGYVNATLPTQDKICPMNVTAMAAYLDQDLENAASKTSQVEYALSLNTNPFAGVPNVGLNFELSAIDSLRSDAKTVYAAAIELLVSF